MNRVPTNNKSDPSPAAPRGDSGVSRALATLLLALFALIPPASAEIHMLTWAGGGADDTCVARTKEIVDWWNSYRATGPQDTIVWHYTTREDRWRTVLETGVDPLTGARIDVIYVPGGWHPERYWHFDWVSALYRAQIDLGIGYVGVCAGAYLHAGDVEYDSGSPGHQDLLQDGVTVVDGMNGPNRICRVLILPDNPLTPDWTWNNVFTYKYWNGPGFGPEDGLQYDQNQRCWVKYASIEGKDVMIKIWPVGEYLDTCRGWAIVAGQYFVREGDRWVPRGRFVLFGPHPELTNRAGAHALLAKAIIWAAGRELHQEERPTFTQQLTTNFLEKSIVAALVSTAITVAIPEQVKKQAFQGLTEEVRTVFERISDALYRLVKVRVPPEDLFVGSVLTAAIYLMETLVEWLTTPAPASA